MGRIEKGSKMWCMMADLFKLVEVYESTNEDNEVDLAKKQNEFEKKYSDITLARELSEAISKDYLKNRRKEKNG